MKEMFPEFENTRGGDWLHTIDQYSESGIDIGDEYDTIRKGSKLHRVATKDDVVDDRRKYVSILPNDSKTYVDQKDFIGIPDDRIKDAREFILTAIKDIKVPNSKEIVDYILDKYGDKQVELGKWGKSSISNDYDFISKFRGSYNDEFVDYIKDVATGSEVDKNRNISRSDAKLISAMIEYENLAERAVNKMFKETAWHNETNMNDIQKEFLNRGYDAIVDLEDKGLTDYPLILLNPKESVTITDSREI